MSDFLHEPATLYLVAPLAWKQALITVAVLYAAVGEIAEQWHAYAPSGERHPILRFLRSGARGKHTLDFFEDPAPYAIAFAAGLDVFLLAALAAVIGPAIQWWGVNWGEGLPALWRGEEDSYEVGSVALPKWTAGIGRLVVFSAGLLLLAMRCVLLAW